MEPYKERVVGRCLENMFLSLYPVDILSKSNGKTLESKKEMLAKMVLYHYLIVADQFFFDDFHGVEALSFLELYH